MASRPGWVAVGLRLGDQGFWRRLRTLWIGSRHRFEVATSFVLIGRKRRRDMDLRSRREMAFLSCDLKI